MFILICFWYWFWNSFLGAKRLIEHLHKSNVPFALATSSSEENSHLKMQKHQDFFSLFNHKVFGTSDPEVKRGKPMPDIFLICASRFPDNPAPENVCTYSSIHKYLTSNTFRISFSVSRIRRCSERSRRRYNGRHASRDGSRPPIGQSHDHAGDSSITFSRRFQTGTVRFTPIRSLTFAQILKSYFIQTCIFLLSVNISLFSALHYEH